MAKCVNKLSLNIKKTKFVLFRSSNKKPKHKIKINLDNKNIELKVQRFLVLLLMNV